ncbi:MAG: hypothetical protein K6T86_17760 [Pirellulales bacterium]|nr:hypothetical protein [Pirellulales bacterium]
MTSLDGVGSSRGTLREGELTTSEVKHVEADWSREVAVAGRAGVAVRAERVDWG